MYIPYKSKIKLQTVKFIQKKKNSDAVCQIFRRPIVFNGWLRFINDENR